jgi:UDP-N-acetylglucosamine 2-epimerase (non-hydrolysing)
MKIAVVLGTRPEIIRMSPVIRECVRRNGDYFILHSGQHYSPYLDKVFFDELGLPKVKYNLSIGSGSHAEETGKMMIAIEKILIKESPDIVLVQGDTNTVLAASLVASKLHIKVGHVEAGVRSYDRIMPEEINRIVVDHIADYLFAPTTSAKKILLNEGINEDKIYIVGNTIVDALIQNMNIADKKVNILDKLNLAKGDFFLITAHREENVDNRMRLEGLFEGLALIHRKFKKSIVLPLHPRTRNRIDEFGLSIPEFIKLIEPLGFLEFLQLEKYAHLVLTDSGGVQLEACILNTPCVTLRDNTEWIETIEVKANMLSGCDPNRILQAVEIMYYSNRIWNNPYGDGTTGNQILDILI